MTNTTTTKFHKFVLCSLIIAIVGKCKGDFFNDSQIYWECTAGQNYTEGSPLDTNIQTVLHNISAAEGYKTAVYGDNPDKVYALSECRGDKTPSQCRKCLKGASKRVKELCGKSPGAQIWYDDWDGCYLHFEHDTNFIGVLTTGDGQNYFANGDNVSGNATSFRNTVVNLMQNLAYEVTNINNNSVKRYASGTALDSSSSRKIFGLVQCWRDISVDDCKSCLARSIDMISSYLESLGGINLCGSCIARYEPFSFFSASPPPPPSPPRTITHDFPSSHENTENPKSKLPGILGSIGGVFLLLFLSICCYITRRKERHLKRSHSHKETRNPYGEGFEDEDRHILFTMQTLMDATHNFHDDYKLGEGGFGVVYKGILANGKEIAVKKLLLTSPQMKKEFMNEVRLVASTQHRNLVNLLGCCNEGSDRLLVYEYLSNKSLDQFLFDSEKRKILDWSKRINIIHGIIKGLLYMHEESMLRIIHRDIKAGNILLDDKYNAKIADFGLAKLFHGDQSCIHTAVAGTRGYMAPEYVMHGQLSIKADVYSFGILLLEIISGRKNNELSHNDMQGFLAWAWKSYREGSTREMLDETLKENCNYEEAARCTQVGLLCTQADPYRRPLMSQINMMLSKNLVTLPNPMKPAFLSMSMTSYSVCDSKKCENEKLSRACESSTSRSEISADRYVTILEPR